MATKDGPYQFCFSVVVCLVVVVVESGAAAGAGAVVVVVSLLVVVFSWSQAVTSTGMDIRAAAARIRAAEIVLIIMGVLG